MYVHYHKRELSIFLILYIYVTLTMLKVVPRSIDHTRHAI
nr:MAG TPA: hypothetical protein [Caudoviricetes sp.]